MIRLGTIYNQAPTIKFGIGGNCLAYKLVTDIKNKKLHTLYIKPIHPSLRSKYKINFKGNT